MKLKSTGHANNSWHRNTYYNPAFNDNLKVFNLIAAFTYDLREDNKNYII